MKARLLTIVVTLGVLLAAGAVSVYASSQVLGSVRLPTLFVQPVQAAADPAVAQPQATTDQGLLVMFVVPDSPAAKAGIQRGNIITAVDGQAVNDPKALELLIAGHKPGDTVKLTLTNCATPGDVSVTLAAHPADARSPNAPPAGTTGDEHGWLGVMVAPPFTENGPFGGPAGGPGKPGDQGGAVMMFAGGPVMFFNESGADHGVAVLGVTAGSPADRAGLRPGDVIVKAGETDVFHGPELFMALEQAKAGDTLKLQVLRGDQTLDLAVTLGQLAGQPDHAALGVYAWSPIMPKDFTGPMGPAIEAVPAPGPGATFMFTP